MVVLSRPARVAYVAGRIITGTFSGVVKLETVEREFSMDEAASISLDGTPVCIGHKSAVVGHVVKTFRCENNDVFILIMLDLTSEVGQNAYRLVRNGRCTEMSLAHKATTVVTPGMQYVTKQVLEASIVFKGKRSRCYVAFCLPGEGMEDGVTIDTAVQQCYKHIHGDGANVRVSYIACGEGPDLTDGVDMSLFGEDGSVSFTRAQEQPIVTSDAGDFSIVFSQFIVCEDQSMTEVAATGSGIPAGLANPAGQSAPVTGVDKTPQPETPPPANPSPEKPKEAAPKAAPTPAQTKRESPEPEVADAPVAKKQKTQAESSVAKDRTESEEDKDEAVKELLEERQATVLNAFKNKVEGRRAQLKNADTPGAKHVNGLLDSMLARASASRRGMKDAEAMFKMVDSIMEAVGGQANAAQVSQPQGAVFSDVPQPTGENFAPATGAPLTQSSQFSQMNPQAPIQSTVQTTAQPQGAPQQAQGQPMQQPQPGVQAPVQVQQGQQMVPQGQPTPQGQVMPQGQVVPQGQVMQQMIPQGFVMTPQGFVMTPQGQFMLPGQPMPQVQQPQMQQAQMPMQQAQMPMQQAQMPMQQAQMPMQQAQMPMQQAQMPMQQMQQQMVQQPHAYQNAAAPTFTKQPNGIIRDVNQASNNLTQEQMNRMMNAFGATLEGIKAELSGQAQQPPTIGGQDKRFLQTQQGQQQMSNFAPVAQGYGQPQQYGQPSYPAMQMMPVGYAQPQYMQLPNGQVVQVMPQQPPVYQNTVMHQAGYSNPQQAQMMQPAVQHENIGQQQVQTSLQTAAPAHPSIQTLLSTNTPYDQLNMAIKNNHASFVRTGVIACGEDSPDEVIKQGPHDYVGLQDFLPGVAKGARATEEEIVTGTRRWLDQQKRRQMNED